jgi:uroporphyrinogen decarboxylase
VTGPGTPVPTPQDLFLAAVRRTRPARLPVASCISSQYICRKAGVAVADYLFDARTKLAAQLAFQEEHPGLLLVPGIYPDFGCGVVEPSAFGCRLVQREDNPLSPEPVCPQAMRAEPGSRSIRDALDLPMPDVRSAGLLPKVLEQYRYFHEHLPARLVERYGYLDGFAFAMGPVETAALVIGYENFLVGLVDFPDEIHELLNRVTDFSLAWLRVQESVNGPLRRIYFFDHTPARVGAAHFEEFIFPYLSTVLHEYPRAIRIYHICDRSIGHVAARFPDMGVDVLYFAADIAQVKAAVGRRLCLMGNLPIIDVMLRGTPASIAAEAGRCRAVAEDDDGGFVLAPGGALIPGTPAENIRALEQHDPF